MTEAEQCLNISVACSSYHASFTFRQKPRSLIVPNVLLMVP